MPFETVAKDLAARIAVFETPHGRVETPTIMPVVNPTRQALPMDDLKRAGAQMVITNSYMIWKNRREEALQKGVHKLIGFDGPVMTDSGAFQLMEYGDIDVSNDDIVAFQKDIGVDIGVILDLPGLATKEEMQANILETYRRAKRLEKGNSLWAGPIQGGTDLKLRKLACRKMAGIDFDTYAIGTVVPLLNSYDFATNIDIIATCKQHLPLNKPVHHFGAGHPMFFAFAVAMGVDLFDSAAYSLFAQKGKYLTVSGTIAKDELAYLPCSCPVCSKASSPQELTEKDLALHNLYVTFEEIGRIKQCIHDGTLWELLEERARAHPALYLALQRVGKNVKYLESLDPFTKKRFMYLSKESMLRPELLRHKQLHISSKRLVDAFPFKRVPMEIIESYPYGQRVTPESSMVNQELDDLSVLNGLGERQFGVKGLFDGATVEKSRKTGRIRRAYRGTELLAAVSPSSYTLIPHASAKDIHAKTKRWRVVVSDDAVPFVEQGKNAFAKFVESCDPGVRAGMEVLLVDKRDRLLGSGTAFLCAREMLDFDRGVAVATRKN
jgi:7-cyano-7-deazaguanine tRNA-ribosyltransferase